MRDKPPDELHIKWTDYGVDEKLLRSAAIATSQVSVFQEAADRAVVVDDKLTLDGAALANYDAAVMEYRLLANMGLQRRDAFLHGLHLNADVVRELRTRQVNGPHLFNGVIPIVRERMVKVGCVFPKPISKSSSASSCKRIVDSFRDDFKPTDKKQRFAIVLPPWPWQWFKTWWRRGGKKGGRSGKSDDKGGGSTEKLRPLPPRFLLGWISWKQTWNGQQNCLWITPVPWIR